MKKSIGQDFGISPGIRALRMGRYLVFLGDDLIDLEIGGLGSFFVDPRPNIPDLFQGLDFMRQPINRKCFIGRPI
jgi:hypothetical protein